MALGAGPVAIVAAGPLSEGERLGAFVDVPADACLLAYGRASSSLDDIDLAAFADEGTTIAADEGPDPKPSLMLCPPHPSRLYVAAHAASGEGLCVIGAQLVPKEQAAALARALGARNTSSAPARQAEAWPGLEEAVRTHRSAIGGVWEDVRRVAMAADTRSVTVLAFNIDEGGCSDVLVVPDEELSIVDVDVLDAEGRLVTRARDGGPSRAVTVCSSTAMNGSLQIRPHAGRGLVAVAVAKGKGATSHDLLTRPDVVWVQPTLSLDATRKAREAALTKAGYAAPSVSRDGQLQLGRRSTVALALASSTACTRIDVVAGAPLSMVDAAVWDDTGALVASADSPSDAVLFACGHGTVRADLGTRGRPGPFALLVRAERWSDPAFVRFPLAASRMLSRAALGASGLHEGTARGVVAVTLDAAHHDVQERVIPSHQCLRVAMGAEGEGTGMQVRVLDAVTGEELDRSHGPTSALVRACALDAERTVRIEAVATAGTLRAIVGERLVPLLP
jgi:hypothetical protein